MRDEKTIVAELEVARAAYRAKANSLLPSELRPLSEAVRALQQELSDTLSEGAVECQRCGELPHGMLRSPAHGRVPPVYEVGCLTCPQDECPPAQGGTPEDAVAAWNAERRA